MNKIKAFSVFKESLGVFNKNWKYLIKKLWFVLLGYVVGIFGIEFSFAFTNLPDGGSSILTGIGIFGLILTSFLVVISYLNIMIYATEFGVSGSINRTGMLGLRLGEKELKLALSHCFCIGFTLVIGLLAFKSVNALYEYGFTVVAIITAIVWVGVSFYAIVRLGLAFPACIYGDSRFGIRGSWQLTKGRVLTVLALCLLTILVHIVLGLILYVFNKPLEMLIENHGSAGMILGTVLSLFLSFIITFISFPFADLAVATLYKRIKEAQKDPTLPQV